MHHLLKLLVFIRKGVGGYHIHPIITSTQDTSINSNY